MNDNYTDGWRRFSDTWHYVSTSSFKMSGDKRTTFPMGTRIRFAQYLSGVLTDKYFAVASVSYSSSPNETTVTVVVTSINTVADGQIYNPSYSYERSPQGFPGSAGDSKIAKVALTAGNANAIAFAWQNPEASKIVVTRVLVDRTTAGGTATSVLDVGPVADATSTSDALIDGLDINATGIADNISDAGTNGKSRAKLDENGGSTDYLTGKILVANAASLVGNVYIHYHLV